MRSFEKGVSFRMWAPERRTVTLVILGSSGEAVRNWIVSARKDIAQPSIRKLDLEPSANLGSTIFCSQTQLHDSSPKYCK
jgi:hypothetical protein